MHFLSHYYYELPAKSPLFVAALGIPDLTPGFSKAYNSVIKNSVIHNNPDFEEIQKGILSHYKADKAFHNSPVFMNQLTLTTDAFLEQGLDRQRLRLSVIAHVAVELMIDRQILIENEQLCVDYYEKLNNASEEQISAYFDAFLPADSKRNFLIRFKGFKQGRFLFLFNDIEKIVEGLSRIYQRVTRIEFTPHEKLKFLNALNNIDSTIRYSWKQILNKKVYE
jgi:hypothetical protein